jgi:hypothetical protein
MEGFSVGENPKCNAVTTLILPTLPADLSVNSRSHIVVQPASLDKYKGQTNENLSGGRNLSLTTTPEMQNLEVSVRQPQLV